MVDEGGRKLDQLYSSAFRTMIMFLYPQPVREPKTA